MLLLNRTLLKMAKGLWGWIATITLLKLATLAGTAAFARIVSGFLGNLDSPEMTAAQAGSAVLYALLTAAAMLISELLTGEAEYRCTAKARQQLRTGIFSKVLELDVGNVEKIGPVSAITSSVDGVESMTVYYSKYLPGLVYSLIAPFYLFFQLRAASLPVAVALMVISLVLLPVNNLFRKHIESLKTEYWNSLEDMTGYYLENVQGLTTLKLYGQDERRTDGLREKAYHFNNKIMDVMRVNFSSFLLTDGLIYASVVLALAIAGGQLVRGEIDFSAALMVLMLAFGFFGSVRQLMSSTHSALAGVSAADKVEKLLDIDTTRPYRPDLPREEQPFDGIRLEHVCFSYEGRKAALKDVSLEIPRGKVTALAGLSGCGKSTVAALLMRFSDLDSGRIVMEGRDYVSIAPEELRRHIIMVPQSVSLFSGTIADNLRMAAPNATEQEMLDALGDVRLKDWVLAQPDGLNTDVGDAGGKLSGGQRQKIGIARALLCRAEYIIFDESTSSVDVESEQEIWNCIRELALTRTLIIISHRLSSIENADCIYVLSGGRIEESGNHAALMGNRGLYRRLVEEQAELEKQGEEHIHA
ncbi:MAG: ATP-binding cassette domain-containing protein [Clostridia bacterium]|nr:ATP-binding cassette domain-containing protein [Clostridia bacterium]